MYPARTEYDRGHEYAATRHNYDTTEFRQASYSTEHQLRNVSSSNICCCLPYLSSLFHKAVGTTYLIAKEGTSILGAAFVLKIVSHHLTDGNFRKMELVNNILYRALIEEMIHAAVFLMIHSCQKAYQKFRQRHNFEHGNMDQTNEKVRIYGSAIVMGLFHLYSRNPIDWRLTLLNIGLQSCQSITTGRLFERCRVGKFPSLWLPFVIHSVSNILTVQHLLRPRASIIQSFALMILFQGAAFVYSKIPVNVGLDFYRA